MRKKYLIYLIMLIILSIFTSALTLNTNSLTKTRYTGEWEIIHQTEIPYSLYKKEKTVILGIQEVGEETITLSRKEHLICIHTDKLTHTVREPTESNGTTYGITDTVYSVPNYINVRIKNKSATPQQVLRTHKSVEIKKFDKATKKNKTEIKDKYEFCTKVNPQNTFWVKFDDHSTIAVQKQEFFSDAILDNATIESNSSHITVSDSNILAYHQFDINRTTTAYDYSRYNEDATIINAKWTSSGKFGAGAYAFDGSGDYLWLESGIDKGENFTIGFWAKYDDPSPPFYSVLSLKAHDYLYIRIRNATHVQFSQRESDLSYADAIYCNMTPGRFFHLGFTGNKTHVEAYVNGTFCGISAWDGTKYKRLWNDTLGNVNSADGSYSEHFNGTLDDFIVINDSSNSSQMTELYNNQKEKYYLNSSHTLKSVNVTVGTTHIIFSLYGTNQYEGTSIREQLGYWYEDLGYNDLNETGLDASYHLDNSHSYGESDTNIYDFSGNGRNGNVTGAIWTSDGYYGGGFEFDGDNDSIKIGAGQDFSNFCDEGCTVCGWIKHKNNETYQSYVSRRDATDSNRFFELYYHAGYWKFVVYRGGIASPNAESTYAVPDADKYKWNHVCGTYNGSLIATGYTYLYINGVFKNKSVGEVLIYHPQWNDLEDTLIGLNGDSNLVSMNGTIDEIQLYNRTLNATEIKKLYLDKLPKFTYSTQKPLNSTHAGHINSTRLKARYLKNSNQYGSYSPDLIFGTDNVSFTYFSTEILINSNYTTPSVPLFGGNVTYTINTTVKNSTIIYSNFSLTHVNESEKVNSYDCLGNITAAACADGVDGDWLSYAFPDSYYASAYILVNQTLGKNLTGANITVRGATPTSYYSGVNVTFCFNSSDEWEIVIPTVNTNYLTLLAYPLPSSCLTNETLQLKFGVRSTGLLVGESFKFYGFKVEQFILKINNSNGTRNGDLWTSDIHKIIDNSTYFYNVSISDGYIQKNISTYFLITDVKSVTPNTYVQIKQPSESFSFNLTFATNNANLEWNLTSLNGFENNITIDGLGIINFSGNHTHQLNLTVNATAGTHLHQDTLTITRLLDGYNETIELNITVSLSAGNIYLINDDNYIEPSFSSTETKTKTWLLNNTGDYNLSDCLCDINGDFTGRSFFSFNETFFSIPINQTKNITLTITNPFPVSTYTGLLQCECNATLLGDKDSLEPSNQPTISITVIEGVTPITPGGSGSAGGISEVEPRFDVLAERSLQLRYYQQEDTNKSREYIFTNLHTAVLEVKLSCISVGNYCDFVYIPNSTLYLQPNILQPFIMDITTYLPINYTNESITFSIISRDEFGGEIKIDTEVIVSGRIFTLGTLFAKFKQFYQVGKLNIPKAVPIVFLTGFLTSFVYILSRKLTAQYALTFIGFFISMFISLLLIP